MSGSMVEVIGSSTTPRMGRRSMALADIDPKYVSQSGIWEASEVETSRGSIRIQHLTAVASGSRASSSSASSTCGGTATNPRFPKLEECAHFHYDCVELPSLKIHIRDDPAKPINVSGDENVEKCAFSIEVVSGGQCWAIRRTHANLFMLDEQLHRCVWDRSFSLLEKVEEQTLSSEEHNDCTELVTRYLARLSELPTNKITCGTVLSWLELDNRGRHIVSSDDCAINTPAVAAACAVRKYTAQAADEISFEVGDMISVIDMPPPEDSIWWRGKRGFHVGFFPRDYVQVIGDKVPAGLPKVPSVRRLQRLSVTSSLSSAPDKPVLRKHGKLIAFFRSFILSRPSRRRLKQSGILRERVFSCDLAEHLLNTGNEIPAVLDCCSAFIEKHGIVDGVYRLSGITSNIQKLRNSFDEDKVPNLEGDIAIKQDIHAVSSLLKMYFRELPNPLCTYQLYEKFVAAAKASDEERLFQMREVVHELPPPHYRTLEYLMKHLSRVAQRSTNTGMTPKNMAIVWAPNLIRCRELEAGGVAALKGIGVQAVVTEYLIRHADLIFNDKLPANFPATTTVLSHKSSGGTAGRPKSLAISSPIRMMSLEEAQDKAKDDRKFIEVGGGPSSLPPQYHTVIDLPSRRGGLKSKRSPMGWKHFFSRNRSFSKPQRKMFTPGDITVITRNMPMAGPQGMQTNWAGRLRPVKSVESLVSSPLYNTQESYEDRSGSGGRDLDSESVMEEMETQLSKSSPSTPVTTDVHVMFHHPPPINGLDPRSLLNSKTHNRSISHDSYFEFGEFRNGNDVYIDETLEEETMSQSSKLSLELSSGIDSNLTSPIKGAYVGANCQSTPLRFTKSEEKENQYLKSPVTPPPSVASINVPMSDAGMSTSSEDLISNDRGSKVIYGSRSPLLKPRPRPSKWRDSEVQTSNTKLADVGVSTQEDLEGLLCSNKSIGTSFNNENNVNIHSYTGATQIEEFKYELDKNSSFDESSEMSTPEEENLCATNIVYSPLVNEIASTSTSSEQLKSHPEINGRNSDMVSLFVCPLYEAGITASEFASNGSDSSSNSKLTSPEVQSPPKYENVRVSNSKLPSVVESVIVPAQQLEVCHIYENHRIYQNEPIAPARRKPSPTAVATIQASPDREADSKFHTSPVPPAQLQVQPEDELYGGEHYENISETDYKTEGGQYEGNIYEDIDSESVLGSGRYETIEISSREKSPGAPPPPVVDIRSVDPKQSMESEDENETTYESVRYSKIENRLLPVPHHYSEIPELTEGRKTPLVDKKSPVSEESSPSHSRTDEMITYLEVQTPSLQLRSDSLDDQEQKSSEEPSYECVEASNENGNESHSGTIESPNSNSEEGEIRHIDSPLVVENSLYSLAMGEHDKDNNAKDIDNNNLTDNENDNENDISMNESLSISISLEEPCHQREEKVVSNVSANYSEGQNDSSTFEDVEKKPKELKLLARCNSAPLTETKHDLILTDIIRQCDGGTESNDNTSNSIFGAQNNQGFNSINITGGSISEKMSLCKRLSEPSLLFSNNQNKTDDCNFEANAAWKLADAKRLANRKQSVKELLSKFESRDSPSPTNLSSSPGPGLPKPSAKSPLNSRNKPFGGSGRFQHHRFSMGDILMTQSMSSAEDLHDIKASSKSMVRSDTYPELRSEGSACKENVLVDIGGGSQSLVDNGSPLVAEKVQQALRVAMSSVDMNDPSTRERIEKYKEERRTFLRQKIGSEISGQRSPSSQSDGKESPSPKKSPCNNDSETFSIETVFSKITQTTELGSKSTESPRKRAFSEDIPPAYSNSIKSIKTEPMKSPNNQGSTDNKGLFEGGLTAEEINVKEKIAMWTVQKKEMSQSTMSCAEIKDTGNRPLEKFSKPILRREVTTSSIEISKSKITRLGRTDSGKKIKDMTAFFEGKQF